MKERNPINEQEGIAVETPVTIQILSSAENTYLLQSRLKDILVDASCTYANYFIIIFYNCNIFKDILSL
ncbi:MAG: hypothetical protein WA364_23125 [Candidatus Nitrosopolaris sp.]